MIPGEDFLQEPHTELVRFVRDSPETCDATLWVSCSLQKDFLVNTCSNFDFVLTLVCEVKL